MLSSFFVSLRSPQTVKNRATAAITDTRQIANASLSRPAWTAS